jgi:hypothetical protein
VSGDDLCTGDARVGSRTASTRLTLDQLHRARLTVLRNSTDREDLTGLLDMLGLLDSGLARPGG